MKQYIPYNGKYVVYMLKWEKGSYIGMTSNFEYRIGQHLKNYTGKCGSRRGWEENGAAPDIFILGVFEDKRETISFERAMIVEHKSKYNTYQTEDLLLVDVYKGDELVEGDMLPLHALEKYSLNWYSGRVNRLMKRGPRKGWGVFSAGRKT